MSAARRSRAGYYLALAWVICVGLAILAAMVRASGWGFLLVLAGSILTGLAIVRVSDGRRS